MRRCEVGAAPSHDFEPELGFEVAVEVDFEVAVEVAVDFGDFDFDFDDFAFDDFAFGDDFDADLRTTFTRDCFFAAIREKIVDPARAVHARRGRARD